MTREPTGLLAIDIDGTLLTDHGHITDSVRKSLARAREAGWVLTVASGRTLYAAREVIEELPVIGHAVLSNGSVIVSLPSCDVEHMVTLPPGTARSVVAVMRDHGAIPALYDTNITDQRVFYDTLDGACRYFEWYVTEDRRCRRVKEVLDHTDDVLQIGTIASREVIFDVRDMLAGERNACVMALPFESSVFGGKNREYWFLQVVAATATKHAALTRLAAMLDIPQGRVVAVGDNFNDIEMIDRADVGVAMGNAPDEVKRVADLVVGPNNSSGLSDLVERVLFGDEFFAQTD